MANKLFKPFNRVMGAIGLIDEEEEVDYEEMEEEEIDDEIDEPEVFNPKKNKVVSIKGGSAPKVLLKKPQQLEDILEIVDAVKERKIVVMNIIDVEQRLAQRMIDYVVGGCYALNGSFQEIAKSIYLVAPDTVAISNELKQVLDKNVFYSFNDR